MLELVGLDADADATYGVLLSGRLFTADDLIVATGLPRPRLRGVLRVLEVNGLVRRRVSSPVRYVALDPGIALDVLLIEKEHQIKRARALALVLSEAFRRSPA